ncbi:Monocarboxylate transporter 2 [Fasciola hepatica]|uniref:Monocarboxylate transporter 2 n=1 Tax=Fasciola hepatica TaxID=6192 RepID=A0A4E0R8E9_FASHE|nr:Monocarboxylate transporter 2 [Fasciola hepatica]
MSTVYVDSPSAWFTVAGGFVANFLLGGLAKSYGLVMEAFQEEFQSGTAYLLLAGGLIYTLMYCLSLVNHYLSLRYGSRPIVLVGAIGSCVSLLVAAYSPNIALWVIAIGLGVGASLSCIYFTVFSVIGQCFRRYLGLANGISVAGVSVGQMAFPSLITYLNQTYGTRGGTVVMSAICLHLLITAALLPRHIVDPDAPPPSSEKKAAAKLGQNRRPRRRFKLRRKLREKSVNSQDREVVELTANSTLVSLDAVDLLENGGSAFGGADKTTSLLELDGKALTTAMGDVPADKSNDTEVLSQNGSVCRGSVRSFGTRHARSLSHALLAVYILAKIFGDIGDVSVSFIAPTHGTKLGLNGVTVSRAIAIGGGVDLVSRLGVGWLTDRPGCVGRRGLLLAITWIVEGLNTLAFTELYRLKPVDAQIQETPTALIVGYFICFGIHGVCSGTAMTQMVVVLADWVGSARLPHSLALTMLVLGLLISPGQFAIGYLADVAMNYVWPLRLCFFILIIAGFLLLMEFPVRWFYSRAAHRHYSAVSTINSLRLISEKPAMNGIHTASDCWQVVDSDSAENEEYEGGKHNEAVLGVDDNDEDISDDGDDGNDAHSSGALHSTETHQIQSGVSPVPANLALIDAVPSPAALFVCAQQRSDDWNDSEGV